MTTVNPGKAQQVIAGLPETFEQYRNRVRVENYPIKYRDEMDEETGALIKQGDPIVLNKESEYSCILLELERKLTTEEFGVVFTAIMGTIHQFEAGGQLPTGLVKDVGTPIDLFPPPVPERFYEELDENEELQIQVAGFVGYDVVKRMKPVEPEPEPEE
jgi:hypothetical protein